MTGFVFKRKMRNIRPPLRTKVKEWRPNTNPKKTKVVGINASNGVNSKTPTIRCSIKISSS